MCSRSYSSQVNANPGSLTPKPGFFSELCYFLGDLPYMETPGDRKEGEVGKERCVP